MVVIPQWERREEAEDGRRLALAAWVGGIRIMATDHFLWRAARVVISVVAVERTIERRTLVPSSLAARL